MGASNVIMSTGAGAAAGGAVGGPWGAVAGGAICLAAGLFGEYEAASSESEKRKVLEKASKMLNASTSELQSLVNQWYKDNPSIGSRQDVETYSKLIHSYDPN